MARYTAEIILSEFDDKNISFVTDSIVLVFREARKQGDNTVWIDVESSDD